MEIEKISGAFTICKVKDISGVNFTDKFMFLAKTDEEISLVCLTENVPENFIERSDNWRAFRVKGQLDFALVGILAEISGLLAHKGISLFAVSTFNTDYILVREKDYNHALDIINKNFS